MSDPTVNPVSLLGDTLYISSSIQSDWNQTDSTASDYIKNKPSISGGGGGTQANSDWNASSGVAQILNKPTLATVATSGNYTDLSNKPTLGSLAAKSTITNVDVDAAAAISTTKISGLATVATSGNYTDLSNKPTLGSLAAKSTITNADVDAAAAISTTKISGLATVATSGNYTDLTNKPTIPVLTTSTTFGTTAGSATSFGTNSWGTTVNGSTLTIGTSQTVSTTATHTATQTGIVQTAIISCTGETGTATSSTAPAASFRVPFAWKILGARASYTNDTDATPPTAAIVIDIRYNATPMNNNTQGTSIFDTQKLNIDASKYSTVTSTLVTNNGRLAAGASSVTVSDDNVVSVFITSTSTGATGVKVTIYYTL